MVFWGFHVQLFTWVSCDLIAFSQVYLCAWYCLLQLEMMKQTMYSIFPIDFSSISYSNGTISRTLLVLCSRFWRYLPCRGGPHRIYSLSGTSKYVCTMKVSTSAIENIVSSSFLGRSCHLVKVQRPCLPLYIRCTCLPLRFISFYLIRCSSPLTDDTSWRWVRKSLTRCKWFLSSVRDSWSGPLLPDFPEHEAWEKENG